MNSERKSKSLILGYKSMIKTEFSGYNGNRLLKDALAGLTVAAVALPLALAFGAASVDAEHAQLGILAGLITAIIAGIVTGIFGGGSFQISGPTGAMTVILSGIVGGAYGIQGMFMACFMAGIILFLAGLVKLGKLLNFIPKPVITGFTSGIAIVIALGQLGNFFGVALQGESTVDKAVCFFTDSLKSFNVLNVKTVCCSVAVMLIMILFPKKWSKIVPGSLVAIILLTLTAVIFTDFLNIKKIGEIPASIVNTETLDFSAVSFEMIKELVVPAFTIAILGMIESLMCGVSASNMKKESFDSNIELVAQGLGNVIVPLFGGVPSTAAIARTSVAIKSGGQTRLTSVFQSLFLIVCTFLLSPVIAYVPYAALAGVLMVTAFKMNDWEDIKRYFSKKSRSSIALFLVTMISTVVLDLIYAIIIGVGASLIIMLGNLSSSEADVATDESEGITTTFAKGPLIFANARDFVHKLGQHRAEGTKKHVIDLSGVTFVDESALEIIGEYLVEIKNEVNLLICGANAKVRDSFLKNGFTDKIGIELFSDCSD